MIIIKNILVGFDNNNNIDKNNNNLSYKNNNNKFY